MAESCRLNLPDPAATAALGARLGAAIRDRRPARLVIALEGELGAGKTSLARALLGVLGHAGRVPSPTYTLVEPYQVAGYTVYHVDLYRLSDPAELDYLGLADELVDGTILLTEWGSRAGSRLPPPDLRVVLELAEPGRLALLTALTPDGARILDQPDFRS